MTVLDVMSNYFTLLIMKTKTENLLAELRARTEYVRKNNRRFAELNVPVLLARYRSWQRSLPRPGDTAERKRLAKRLSGICYELQRFYEILHRTTRQSAPAWLKPGAYRQRQGEQLSAFFRQFIQRMRQETKLQKMWKASTVGSPWRDVERQYAHYHALLRKAEQAKKEATPTLRKLRQLNQLLRVAEQMLEK